MRFRRNSIELFFARGFPHIYILPVRIQRQRHSVLFYPAPHYPHRRPNGFLLPQPRQRGSGGIIHQVHQAALWSALLEPFMKTAIQLHQLSKVLSSLPSFPVPPSFSRPAPLPICQPPPPQRLRTHFHLILAAQTLRRHRLTQPFPPPPPVYLPHPPPH